MISLRACAAISGLSSDEQILGAAPTGRHRQLLSSYLLNLTRGPAAVREMIVDDLRRFHELGALHYAADLLLVLRLFLTEYPEAAFGQDREAPPKPSFFGCPESKLTEASCWLCVGGAQRRGGDRCDISDRTGCEAAA